MTYILGAQCSDGVVLIGDTKITMEGGTDYTYAKKITTPVTNVVMGSAGALGLYRDFQNRVRVAVMEIEKREEKDRHPHLTTIEGFSKLIGDVLKHMNEYYKENRHFLLNNLDIICAMRIGRPKAELIKFSPFGFPEPINQFGAVGHGKYYGTLFLKKIWKTNMSMNQTAKLGLFIIKFIEMMKLDNSVGYKDDFLPQVFYIPDIKNLEKQNEYPIRELANTEIKQFIEEITPKISTFDGLLKEFKI